MSLGLAIPEESIRTSPASSRGRSLIRGLMKTKPRKQKKKKKNREGPERTSGPFFYFNFAFVSCATPASVV